MSDLAKITTLLSQTDGRDKVCKSLLGFFCVLEAVAESKRDPRAEAYGDVVRGIHGARSLMRMGKFVADITKLRGLYELFAAQGITHTDNKKFVEFARVLCNAIYVFLDNIALICFYKVFGFTTVVNGVRCARHSRRAQLVGYILSLVFNVYELRDSLRRLEYDRPAAKRASTRAAVSATRDVFDLVVTAAALGLGKGIWSPSSSTCGMLTCASGSLSTYLNWGKNK